MTYNIHIVTTDTPAMESRIIDLEIRLTHQEAMLQELNDVIIHQQKMIDSLNAEVGKLKQHLRESAPSNIADASQETPPPHY